MASDEIGLRQTHVTPDHIEGCEAQDLLEAEHVAAVDEIAAGERVAERVRRAAGPDRRPPPEAGDRELDPARREGPAPAPAPARRRGRGGSATPGLRRGQ